jgi:hypothetical protein
MSRALCGDQKFRYGVARPGVPTAGWRLMTANPRPPADVRLDDFLADWHFREVHQIGVDVATDVVLRAVLETTWAEAPLGRALMTLTRNDVSAGRRIVADIDGANLLDRTENELVFGMIGSDSGQPALTEPLVAAFRGFDRPGYVKIGLNFRHVAGVLSTETRVYCTDPAGRRAFQLYWLVIRGGSGLVRRSALRAVRRRALLLAGVPTTAGAD